MGNYRDILKEVKLDGEDLTIENVLSEIARNIGPTARFDIDNGNKWQYVGHEIERQKIPSDAASWDKMPIVGVILRFREVEG